MRTLRSLLCGLAVLGLVCTSCRDGVQRPGAQPAASSAVSDNALHAAHDALFASFLPVTDLPNDPKTAGLLKAARDGIWQQARSSPEFHQLLLPFVDLQGFGSHCGIAQAVQGAGAASFAGLSPDNRQRVLFLLQSCSENAPRKLAATVRNFYIVKGYGAVQGQLTGVQLNLFAPPGYVERNQPKLPPTRLAYDSSKKELTEKDGHAIDVLIVGSGPAGSVLAHELRRSGQRVLLLERGSFVVAGSMETRLIDDLVDTRASMDGTIRVRNGMAVGGGSQVNVDLCFAPTTEAIRTKIEGWRNRRPHCTRPIHPSRIGA